MTLNVQLIIIIGPLQLATDYVVHSYSLVQVSAHSPCYSLIAYWSGHHVWPLRASCLDSLEDVHFTLHFDPLNLSHGSDEHTSAGHAITV